MSYDRRQFKSVIETALHSLDPELRSKASVNLLLGTAAQESNFGKYLRQLGSGPALGAFQMEPQTFHWLVTHFSSKYLVLVDREPEDMTWDLRLAARMARLRYRVVPAPLPSHDDVRALAEYWKRYYNTTLGRGTVEEFEDSWRRFLI